MKTLFQTILLFVFAFSLIQCGESVEPRITSDSQDASTSALGKKELVLYAIVNEGVTPPNQFLIELYAPPDTELFVDWGDGTSDQFSYANGIPNFERVYDAPGRYKVTITGDIAQITELRSSSGMGVFDSIDLSVLKRLEGIRVGLTSGPAVIDLSANTKLREVHLTNIVELSEVVLPKRHTISSVSISGPNLLTTANVDYVINNIYTNAVKQNITNGFFSVQRLFFLNEGDEGYNDLVGPPSASSVAMLKTLQDVYGWEIVPALE